MPPPPEKQAVGRFESNFVESRRAALEKMLNKTAAHPTLQNDGDLKLFLESETFNIDVKHKERKEPNLGESKSMLSTLGINVGTTNKFVEQDDVSNAGSSMWQFSFANDSLSIVVPRASRIPRRPRKPAQGPSESARGHGRPAQSHGRGGG